MTDHSSISSLSVERRRVIAAMENLGWTVFRRPFKKWRFERPDTGGLVDVITVQHQHMNLNWLAQTMMQQGDAPTLTAKVRALEIEFVNHQFANLFKEIQ